MTIREHFVRRFVQLLVGLVLYGVGVAFMIRGAIGIAPWDVFAQGISRVTGIEFGWITVLVGVGVLILWIPLRHRPGIGTVLNVLLIGPVAQVVLWTVPEPESLWLRIPLFALGMIVLALATGMYIGAQFGTGPRDGLMTGTSQKFGWPIWVVRTGIEVIVLIIGWIMGGNVGIGTLVFALFIGPLIHPTMGWFDVTRKRCRGSETAIA